MFDKKVTVRADFYSTGEILPLGITYSKGNSQYIDKIVKMERDIVEDKIKYSCLSNGLPIVLVYSKGGWYVEKN